MLRAADGSARLCHAVAHARPPARRPPPPARHRMQPSSSTGGPALLRLEVMEGPAKGTVLHKKGLTLIKVGAERPEPT